MDTVSDTALVLGATMRLTRLVVSDDIGQWWVKDPLDSLFHPRVPDSGANPLPPRASMRWHRYVSGLDCPYCVGFWIGVGVLASYRLAPRTLWRFVAGALTLNEVAAHLGVKIGDFG